MQPERQAQRGVAVHIMHALCNSPLFATPWTITCTAAFKQLLSSHVAKPARNGARGPTASLNHYRLLFPSSALLPATLKNALLELLVTATKTYTKQRSLEVKKKKKKIIKGKSCWSDHRIAFPAYNYNQALQSA